MKVILLDSEKATGQLIDGIVRLAFANYVYGKKCCYCARSLSEIANPRDVITVGGGEDACRECYVKLVGPVIE